MRSSRTTRKIYKEHHGSIPVDENNRTYEIHHIDGDHTNDAITNLVAVTIKEHYDIHYSQGDFRACTLIGKKMNISKDEISELARLSAKSQVAKGIHNFLSGAIQSATNSRRVEDGTHHFLGSNNSAKMIAAGTHHFLTNHPNKIKVICPHCNKTGGSIIMKRYHFDRCKFNPKESHPRVTNLYA